MLAFVKYIATKIIDHLHASISLGTVHHSWYLFPGIGSSVLRLFKVPLATADFSAELVTPTAMQEASIEDTFYSDSY